MKKLLIINKQQFGYLTDVLKWTETLRHDYQVTVVCFNVGHKQVVVDNVNVVYVPYTRYYIINAILFYLYSMFTILRNELIIVEYFQGCEYLKRLFRNKRMLLDVRTLSVTSENDTRLRYNAQLVKECKWFNLISVISQGVREQISDLTTPIFIMPLGADQISERCKTYESLSLLYVGTLSGRDIHKTILGYKHFIDLYPQTNINYHIVGDANTAAEFQSVRKLVEELGLENNVILHGRITYSELKPYFDNCNVGISFVPITSYYDSQPVTKTFEYAMSGLITIGTSTKENCKIINDYNGVLINDDSDAFTNALVYIYNNRNKYRDYQIRQTVADYEWTGLVRNYLIPILKELEA